MAFAPVDPVIHLTDNLIYNMRSDYKFLASDRIGSDIFVSDWIGTMILDRNNDYYNIGLVLLK